MHYWAKFHPQKMAPVPAFNLAKASCFVYQKLHLGIWKEHSCSLLRTMMDPIATGSVTGGEGERVSVWIPPDLYNMPPPIHTHTH